MGLVVAEVGQVEDEGADGLVEPLPLADQEVLEVVELLLLEAGHLEHLGDDGCYIFAQQFGIASGHQ